MNDDSYKLKKKNCRDLLMWMSTRHEARDTRHERRTHAIEMFYHFFLQMDMESRSPTIAELNFSPPLVCLFSLSPSLPPRSLSRSRLLMVIVNHHRNIAYISDFNVFIKKVYSKFSARMMLLHMNESIHCNPRNEIYVSEFFRVRVHSFDWQIA